MRVAAYCRVSTDQEEQLLSYENQVRFYTESINSNPEYECAGIYADEGISGTNTKKRDEFNRMIMDCRAGKIDRIITKSIYRFARNTLDCLNYVRELKGLGIGVTFEKEAIDTLDAKGEVLLTILSSLAQDESRNISENSTWGIRKRFEIGQHKMSTKRFLGYDADENGKLVVNKQQAKIVKRIFMEFLWGKTTDYIKRIFEREGVINWDGGTKWQATTICSMLENEKYKGDTLLQKSYTVEFLTKKRVQNEGEIQQYYIEDDHEAIIEPWIWECVQLEMKRRERYLEEHNITRFSQNTEANPFSSKIICGECNRAFARKGWRTPSGDRKVWQCSERYKVKGVLGCGNRHIDEEMLIEIYLRAWNRLLECREMLVPEWERKMQGEDLLAKFRAMDFMEVTKDAQPIKELNIDLMLRTVNHIKVYESGMVVTVFLDGTEIEFNTEKNS
ncbi:recombinase family protein [Blautia producta]|uniref:recombinase family protein n=1 Tax=Blautia producta TaxID=33035 RepID=UPI0027D47594|nr:recombinase family protein [Blautia coccoides]